MNALLLFQEPGSVQSLPWAAHGLAAGGLATGIIMWLVGRRLLKPGFALLGAIFGAMIGLFTASAATESVFGVPSPYIGISLGALVGLGAGVMLFRFAVAITTGLALALAGGLISAAYLHFSPKPTTPITASSTSLTIPTPALDEAGRLHRFIEGARPMASQVHDFVSQRYDDLHAAWSELPEHDQVVLGVSTLGTGIAGFVLGLFAPRRSAAVATALFGSALFMGCGVWLLHALNVPGNKYLDQGALVWLPTWMALALIGMAIQVSGMGTKTKEAKPE
jgi:hypothetical protein